MMPWEYLQVVTQAQGEINKTLMMLLMMITCVGCVHPKVGQGGERFIKVGERFINKMLAHEDEVIKNSQTASFATLSKCFKMGCCCIFFFF